MRLAVFISLFLSMAVIAGCSMVPSWAGGDSGPVRLDADNEFRMKVEMDLGETLILDVRDPSGSGYEMAGAKFDPEAVSLDAVMADPDNPKRVHYLFRAIGVGESVIEVRIRPSSGGPPEAYKFVELLIEE